MDARIGVVGGDGDELSSLYTWLVDEDGLRGRVRVERRPIGATELGAAVDLLSVALGAGGAGSVLGTALVTWLRSRRTSARITVEVGERSVTLEIDSLRDTRALLEQVLRQGLDEGDGRDV
ncbi:effector-associated constant component EACC1 [Kitasatospora cheerisanensis]|uniref:Uncharacterized protein n=1 Tax=Kitasatospora cheerisanensis KCTC 2395 TaxID=1348663 RepID=A0A066YQC8_9ACTN|nr:hypothetical protein [Kitasatospora cheerisanensis]KDN82164.1 hypothetical protein KCH_60760 [Kitasatospora cheerisanensis KCTC 2395]